MKDFVMHRVWDSQRKMMHYNTGIVGDFLVLEHTDYGEKLSITDCVRFDEKRYKLMPYVLKEDDIFPVYLGDIVQLYTDNGGSQLGIITYDSGTYCYITSKQIEGVLEHFKIPVACLFNFEVVGNVYETAYLIN